MARHCLRLTFWLKYSGRFLFSFLPFGCFMNSLECWLPNLAPSTHKVDNKECCDCVWVSECTSGASNIKAKLVLSLFVSTFALNVFFFFVVVFRSQWPSWVSSNCVCLFVRGRAFLCPLLYEKQANKHEKRISFPQNKSFSFCLLQNQSIENCVMNFSICVIHFRV